MSTIDIVLSTYNAGPYLDAQISSIIRQTDRNWRLLIRDDGSSDQTRESIRQWLERDTRIVQLSDEHGNLGVSASYSRLLSHTTAEIIMLSDQDDIWKPDRIAKGRKQLNRLMTVHGNRVPLLVHTDLELVDGTGSRIADSFWRYQGLNSKRSQRFLSLMVQNVVTGCTMTMNRSLLKHALPVPEEAMMHDWWLALVAALWGNIHTERAALVCYRQHEANVRGAKRYGCSYILQKMIKFYNKDELKQSVQGIVRQASCFMNRYGDQIPDESREGLAILTRLERAGFLEKRYAIVRHGLWKTGIARNIGWFLRV